MIAISRNALDRPLNRIRHYHVEYVANPLFERRDADSRIEELRPNSEPDRPSREQPRDMAETLFHGPLFDRPLLSRAAERYWFLRMNFIRFQAARLRECEPNLIVVRGISRLLDEATRIRNLIVESNQRLIVSIAKRFSDATLPLDELVSEAQLPLLRAVELFDVSRGYCFSTYASHTVRNHCQRVRFRVHRDRGRTTTCKLSEVEGLVVAQSTGDPPEQIESYRRSLIARLFAQLVDRERVILSARFGMGEYERPHSFLEIGRLLGLSKERVRVLARRAIDKLQQTAAQQNLAWSET
jgi:RNA polymerase sigma factor (sigma-70 family)